MDMGTEMRRESPSRNPPHPFMDLGWYTQHREFELYFYEYNHENTRINDKAMSTLRGRLLNPWPERFSGHMWIDRTDRYETIEGFYLKLWEKDEVTDDYLELPRSPHTWIDVTYEPPEVNPQECVTVPLKHHNPNDAANWNPMGLPLGELSRLPMKNETESLDWRFRGYCHLKEPVLTDITGDSDRPIVLEVTNDNLLFAPFDFRHPERYICQDEDGRVLPGTENWLTLRPDMEYVIHLRPRWWRWTVFVLAHYAYISLWGVIPNDEYFWHVFFDRPPVYPFRHDVIHSKQEQGYLNWNNDWRSYDIGIDYYWETTDAAADLAAQILNQQYSWYCVVYSFLGNEDPDLFLEAWPPRKGDIVCCIEQVDKVTRETTPIFVRQNMGLDSVYPDFDFGAFLLNWQVVPEPGKWKPGKG